MIDPCSHGEPAPGCGLIRQLRLTRAGDLEFTGTTRGGRAAPARTFGGGTIAQALLAAGATVPGGLAPGSLHAYFVTPGDAGVPVRYTVSAAGEGQSWALRQVTAGQNGTVRLVMHAAFRRFGASPGSEHQDPAPAAALAGPPRHADAAGDRAGSGDGDCGCPGDVHLPACGLDVVPAGRPGAAEPGAAGGAHRATWLRVRHDLGESSPSQAALSSPAALSSQAALWHAALLAYASDIGTISVVDQPHAGEPGTRRAASVDHAMWFHRPFRADDWLWYGQRSPVYTGGRGMFEGSFYDTAGRLVASCAQEVAIRRVTRPAADSRTPEPPAARRPSG